MVEQAANKHLHVRVAEALGCNVICRAVTGEALPSYECGCGIKVHSGGNEIVNYATDRSACMELIERYSISLHRVSGNGRWGATIWIPNDDPLRVCYGRGLNPMLAVCNVIVAASRSGEWKP